jgi:hypothetical protein
VIEVDTQGGTLVAEDVTRENDIIVLKFTEYIEAIGEERSHNARL